MASPPAPGSPAVVVGRYRLLRVIGQGGMGVVHLGMDSDDRVAAVKVLRPHAAVDPEARARLAREAASLRRLRHPRVAEIVDVDLAGDTPYVAMRYIPGDPLEVVVREHGALSGLALSRVLWGLQEAISVIHAAGLLHRDIKPSNVLLLDGEPVVIDFGIAKALDDTSMTATGMVIGTPGYLAPELLVGSPPTRGVDWWGWAAVAAFAATGRPPFGRGQAEVVLDRIRRGEADLDGLPGSLRAMLSAALGPRPERRPTPGELRSALAAAVGPSPTDHGPAYPVGGLRVADVAATVRGMPEAVPLPATSHLPPGEAAAPSGTPATAGGTPATPPARPVQPVSSVPVPPGSPPPGSPPPGSPPPGSPPPGSPGSPPPGTRVDPAAGAATRAQPPATARQPAPGSAAATGPAPVVARRTAPPRPAPAAHPQPHQHGPPVDPYAPPRPGQTTAVPPATMPPAASTPPTSAQSPQGVPGTGGVRRASWWWLQTTWLVAVVGVGLIAPLDALWMGVVWVATARSVEWTRTARAREQWVAATQSRKPGSRLPLVLAYPFRWLGAVGITLVYLSPLLVAVYVAQWLRVLDPEGALATQSFRFALVTTALLVAAAWWGVGGTTVRRGVRAVTGPITRTRVGLWVWFSFAVLVLVAVVLIIAEGGIHQDWRPPGWTVPNVPGVSSASG